jgi:hypothetical protein
MLHRTLSCCLVALASGLATATAEPLADHWRTPAERSEFRSTPSLEATRSYLDLLQSRAPDRIRVTEFGQSATGRPMPLVIASASGAFTPSAARDTDTAVVLIQCGIHAGEIDGKDAMLAILRDLALGQDDGLLDGVTLLVIPIYNVDGHERVSRFNRPNQDGPAEGMGFRTTARGLDLNRDHLKLDSVEARALVDLVNRWQPDLHVDVHVTNGSDHEWVLTWSTAEAPQLAAPIDAWLDRHLPPVVDATAAAGFPSGPYVSLLDRDDPSRGFDSGVTEPRYSTGYFTLRHTPSILVEMHAYKPYAQRVAAVDVFLRALLHETGDAAAELRSARAAARAETVAVGRPDAAPSTAVVRWQAAPATDTIEWPAYAWEFEESVVTGAPLLVFRRGERRPMEVPWVHTMQPEQTVARPRGYLMLPGWPELETLLIHHGLVAYRLEHEVELEVEAIRVSEPVLADVSYQGRVMMTSFEAERVRERRTVPPGALWIPADQPLFEIAVQLIEPEAPDSMLRWGSMHSVLERKEYIGLSSLEPLAREMLEDPEVEAAWRRALDDPEFAADLRARWLWWYRRTPHWDEQVGLIPALRVMSEVRLPVVPAG